MVDYAETVIIGAGPAGCGAGLTLSQAGRTCMILDDREIPGGMCRSIRWRGATFDVGPHRFFTKSEDVFRIWQSSLGRDLISVDRLTRVLYRKKLFNYPLSPVNALLGLGVSTSVSAMAAYGLTALKRKISPRQPTTFEEWVTDNFGSVLYEAFFKHYTEKVWGIPCSRISADWASQRIKGLNLARAVYNAMTSHKSAQIKTLANRFVYPRNGSGSLYERIMQTIVQRGSTYTPNATVTGIQEYQGRWLISYQPATGPSREVLCDHVLSSMSVVQLLRSLKPVPSPEILAAGSALRFRNHYCVHLLVENGPTPFPDNWIYVHSPELSAARVANYASFCPSMQGAEGFFPLTVEFFSFPGDAVSLLDDSERVQLALRELGNAGLLSSKSVVCGAFVTFTKDAYPVIEVGYASHVSRIKSYLMNIKNLQTCGRAGLFQYNNQDHSMMTGVLAARNILGAKYDLWSVNEDAEYHESGTAPDLCEEDRHEPNTDEPSIGAP